MSAISPENGTLEIAATGGAKAKLLKLVTLDITEGAKALDTTSTDSAGWEENIPGNGNWSAEIKARWETTEGKLVGSPPLIRKGAVVDISAYLDKVNLPNEYYRGTATITSVKHTIANANASEGVDYSFTVQGTGALIYPAAA